MPSGLHFRINLQTGKREAKLIDPQEESLKNIDDDAKEHLSSGLRSYQDLQELKAREKLKWDAVRLFEQGLCYLRSFFFPSTGSTLSSKK